MPTALAFRRVHLAGIARDLACRQLAGDDHQAGPAIEPFLAHFRSDPRAGFAWGAAFVYHCVRAAGLDLPPRPGSATPSGSAAPSAFACVSTWIRWANSPSNACYYPAGAAGFAPDVGDLIIFDDVLGHGPHDHIGVLVDQTAHAYVTAEGNIQNRTGVFVRRKDRHINGYILLPEAGEAAGAVVAARLQRAQAATDAPRGYGRTSGTRPGALRRG